MNTYLLVTTQSSYWVYAESISDAAIIHETSNHRSQLIAVIDCNFYKEIESEIILHI